MSNTVTFITGEMASGKTTKAKELTANKRSVWVYPKDFELAKSPFVYVNEATEFIVIDGVTELTPKLIRFFTSDFIMKGRNKLPMPNIIIVMQSTVKVEYYMHTGNRSLIRCTRP